MGKRLVTSRFCAAGPLAKKLCPIPGTTAMSGLLVMRNEVSLVTIHYIPAMTSGH